VKIACSSESYNIHMANDEECYINNRKPMFLDRENCTTFIHRVQIGKKNKNLYS
jgi:hypothetical protein